MIGVGHIGKSHARVYASLPEAARLTAVLDLDAVAAGEMAALYDVRATASLEAFANEVDAATISTPTPTHFEIARYLLERGKHLLVEKPITENTADARSLSELAHARGCVLQVGHIERFNPALVRWKRCSPARASSRRTGFRPIRSAAPKSAWSSI